MSLQSRQYHLPSNTAIDDLTIRTVDVPKPKYNEVLVKIRAVSLNYRDLMVATGKYPMGVKPDVVPCSDGAGEVVQIGEHVKDFKIGDRVVGIFNQLHLEGAITDEGMGSGLGGGLDGVLTEYKIFPDYGVIKFPEYLSYEEAATLPCAAVTAWNCLYGPTPVQAGHSVLLQGTGGVSIFGLQIAHAAGAKTIITSSSDDKLGIAKSLGADHGINYKTTPEWDKEVKKLTNGLGVNHILEVGSGSVKKSFGAVRRDGSIQSFGVLEQTEQDANVPLLCLIGQVNLRGVFVGSRKQFLAVSDLY